MKTPNEIKNALRRAGITQAQIARDERVSASFVSQVICGRKASERVRRALARAMGMPLDAVFPQCRRRGRPREQKY